MPAKDALCLPGEISAGESTRNPRSPLPADILASIPALLGFRPSQGNLIVLGSREDAPPAGPGRVGLRYDLPDWPNPIAWHAITHHAAAVLAAQRYDTMTAVGYGPDGLVSPLIHVLRQAADNSGLRLADLYRVQDGRYWSCLCQDPACCSPSGTPFGENQEPTALLPDGGDQVPANREVLVAALAPADEEEARSMRAATGRARGRVTRVTRRAGTAPDTAREAIRDSGLDAVRAGIARYRNDDQAVLTRYETAWITVSLLDHTVRNDAWYRMDPQHREAHLRLWTGITRLARPGYVAAPASLLAFTAWQCGNGALASVALDRALDDDPRYQMALLLHRIIDSGLPWSMTQDLMPPELAAGQSRPAGRSPRRS